MINEIRSSLKTKVKKNLKGQLGYKGERGDSAYEISVQHGYTGTEEEWANAFLSADYYYTKTEANALLDAKADTSNVYTKGNFAVLTGSVAGEDVTLGGKQLSYPEGFTQDNCTVISAMVKAEGAYAYNTYAAQYNTSHDPARNEDTIRVQMFEDKIKLVTMLFYLDHTGYDYKVVLLKYDIPEEEED